ncbi:DUF3800 domain-containing protein [Geodermatophilus nigrescens]
MSLSTAADAPDEASHPERPRKYLFADESGNFDFRDHHRYPGATRFFAVGTLFLAREDDKLDLQNAMLNVRHDLARRGKIHNEAFHATEDPQWVRDAVFDRLKDLDFKVDVTIMEKAKAQPQTHPNDETFYQYAWYYHLKYHRSYFKPNDDVLIASAALGTRKGRAAFRGAVTSVAEQVLDFRIRKHLAFWPADCDPCLQAVDYVLWAVMREFEKGDDRSSKIVASQIGSVYDLWSRGQTYYYGPNAAPAA